MQTLMSQIPQIRALIEAKQNRARSLLADPVFHLKVFRATSGAYVRIEIWQYIFHRFTLLIKAEDGTGFSITEPGGNAPPPITGPDNFQALHKALYELSLTQTPPTPEQRLAKLFSTARKPKNKYPHKGRVKRA